MAVVLIAIASTVDFTSERRGNEPRNATRIPLRIGLSADEKLTADVDRTNLPQAVLMFSELTGRTLLPQTNRPLERLDDLLGERLSRWRVVKRNPIPDSGLRWHRDGRFSAGEVKQELESAFAAAGLRPVAVGKRYFRVIRAPAPTARDG